MKPSNKRKSKLMWLCHGCDEDFILYKAGKTLKKELEEMRAEINRKMEQMEMSLKTLTVETKREQFR